MPDKKNKPELSEKEFRDLAKEVAQEAFPDLDKKETDSIAKESAKHYANGTNPLA